MSLPPRLWRGLAGALFALPPLLGLTPATAANDLPYERLAQQFLEQHGQPQANPDTFDLHEFLRGRFLHLEVGLFDLYLPSEAGREKRQLEQFKRVAVALSDAQGRWLDWLEPALEKKALRQARGDLADLSRWIERWRVRPLIAGDQAASGDLQVLLGAKDALQQASARFGEFMASGAPLGLQRPAPVREPIVLMPERRGFTEMCCIGGWLYPQHRGIFWQPSIATWTHFYIDDVKVLALEFASPRGVAGDYSSGMSMDYRSETGLEQQILQLAANSMLANYFGDSMPPSLAGGVAVNLVIELYGECNTRVDGDLRARRTAAREVFVPGGDPEGGVLPPNLADSRWRADQGADHFVGVLRHALVQRRRGEPVRFELHGDGGVGREVVGAPFFGSAARSRPPAPEFLGDQLEFLRAYRTCFLDWLRVRGAGKSKKRSQAAFAQFLVELASRGDAGDFQEIVESVYEAPLSLAEPGRGDLEGRFLAWLERQR